MGEGYGLPPSNGMGYDTDGWRYDGDKGMAMDGIVDRWIVDLGSWSPWKATA